jgi:hypothetical protein
MTYGGLTLGQNPPTHKETIEGYLPYRRLTGNDFPVRDTDPSSHGMYTSGFRHYDYRAVTVRANGRFLSRVTDWTVRAGFNRNKSWRKSWFQSLNDALPHEQGHLDISVLHSARPARTSLDKLPTGEGVTEKAAEDDLKKNLQALVRRVTKEAQSEQDAYDAAASHGANRTKQREWTANIKRRLQSAGIKY